MKLPLANNIGTRDATLAKDALLTNCIVEQDGEGFAIYKRPGVDLYSTHLGPAGGTYKWRDKLYSVFNDTLIEESTGDTFPLSIVSYQGQQYQFAQTAGQAGEDVSTGDAWTQKASAPGWGVRQGAASVVFNGKMWLFGGLTTGPTYKNDVWNSEDGVTWTEVDSATNWTARAYHTAVVYDNKMWVMGGETGSGVYVNDVWYSTDGDTWTQATASAAWAIRRAHAAVVYNNKMWVMGGRGAGNLNDVYSSTDGVTWTQVTAAAAWAARMYPVVVEFGGRMYLYSGDDASSTFYNDCYYSTDGITWTAATTNAAWSDRSQAQGVVYDHKFWILGGKDGSSFFNEAYHTTDGATWTSAGTVTTGALGYGQGNSWVFENYMWFANGSDGTARDDVWNSDIDTLTTDVGPTSYLMVKNEDQAWYIDASDAITEITDADYPKNTVPGVCDLDGSFYVMDKSGRIWGSGIGTPATWTANNFLGSEAEPDVGVILTKILTHIVAIGQWSLEFFYNAGYAPASPLSRRNQLYQQVGCAAAGSVAYMENGLIFMSQSRMTGREVMLLIGTQLQKVSTAEVDRVLAADALTEVHAFCIKRAGHMLYVLTLVASSITLVYDLFTKMWGRWTSLIAGTAASVTSLTQTGGVATATVTTHGYSDGDVVTIAGATPAGYNGTFIINKVDANSFTYDVSSALSTPATGTITATGYTDSYLRYVNYVSFDGKDIVQHLTDGKLYQFGTYTNDDEVRINTRSRLPNVSGPNGNFISYHQLDLGADNVSANAYIRWFDDDYTTATTFKKLSLSENRKRMNRLAISRKRAFEIMHADDSAFHASVIEINGAQHST